jgi:hypothetical protein
MLLCSVARLPKLKNSLAMLHLSDKKRNKVKSIDAFVLNLSNHLSKFVKLSDYKKQNMAATLQATGIMMTPETYFARVFVRFIIKLLPAIIIFFVSRPAALIFLIWPVKCIFDDLKKAEKMMQDKIKIIDHELPRFAATISQQLKSSRDVVKIFSEYLPSAGKEFRDELEITIADMKSSSPDKALSRMESRLGSFMISQLVRGLQSVLNGDNGIMYFEMLSYNFKQFEIQELKLEAIKRPDKMRVYSYIILACIFLTLLSVIIIFLYGKLQSLV